MKYFEDIELGEVWDLGSRAVSEAEIIEFATQYDPQPFHIDAALAEQGFFGGLIASGWHTCAIFMGLLADFIKARKLASMGAPGIEHCRWLVPVRPGDVLHGRTTVLALRPSRSKPMGLVTCRTELVNQRGAKVAQLQGVGMYSCRPAADARATAAVGGLI
ncbi:MAG: MaoC family dehydratase [Proteobacteria bacterium]|nr:MaoC family dehydratase [Pseudomonadota bacterium]